MIFLRLNEITYLEDMIWNLSLSWKNTSRNLPFPRNTRKEHNKAQYDVLAKNAKNTDN